MKFFLDTNILLDFLLERQPFHFEANQIFDCLDKKQITLYTSSHSIATTHYFCKKENDEWSIRNSLSDLIDSVKVIGIDEEILRKSLKSHHRDFQDAIQIFCAHQIRKLDGIITRNLRDFSTSEISVFSPDEALRYIKNKLETN